MLLCMDLLILATAGFTMFLGPGILYNSETEWLCLSLSTPLKGFVASNLRLCILPLLMPNSVLVLARM